MSLKERIQQINDLPIEKVNVLEWGFDVWLQGTTSVQRDAYEQSMITTTRPDKPRKGHKGFDMIPNLANAKAKLVALCLVNEDRTPVFGSTAEAERELGNKSASSITKLYEVARRLSGLSDEDIEDLEKNSDETQGSDSATG
jgi:hypothetical protein